MTQERKTNLQGVVGGAVVGLLVIFGGRAIDSILNTDTIKEIKEEIKEMRHEIKEMQSNFVSKRDYEYDKNTMVNMMRARK